MTITAKTTGIWTIDDVQKKSTRCQWSCYNPNDEYELWYFGTVYDPFTGCSCSRTPVKAPGTWKHIVNSSSNYSGTAFYAIKSDGSLWAWGSNGVCLGLGSVTGEITSPTQIPGTWCTVKTNGGTSWAKKN